MYCNCLFPKLKSRDNILRTKRNFKVKRKAFFIIFKEISVFKKCRRPNSPPLNFLHRKVYLLNIFHNIFWTKDVTDFTESVLESSCKVLPKKVKIKTPFDSFTLNCWNFSITVNYINVLHHIIDTCNVIYAYLCMFTQLGYKKHASVKSTLYFELKKTSPVRQR